MEHTRRSEANSEMALHEPEMQELEIIDGLPNYLGYPETHIVLPTTSAQWQFARSLLMQADIVGFDTESKPIFNKGQDSDGPHLIQLATDEYVFLFQVNPHLDIDLIRDVLESNEILKVGFGLNDDKKYLKNKLAIDTQNCIDLARLLRESRAREMGAKAAVTKFLGLNLQKSKRISTSNWASTVLSEKQKKYAADDASCALEIYRQYLSQRTRQALIQKPST
jgi:RNA polymerase sigma factor for flagellar operon FliA